MNIFQITSQTIPKRQLLEIYSAFVKFGIKITRLTFVIWTAFVYFMVQATRALAAISENGMRRDRCDRVFFSRIHSRGKGSDHNAIGCTRECGSLDRSEDTFFVAGNWMRDCHAEMRCPSIVLRKSRWRFFVAIWYLEVKVKNGWILEQSEVNSPAAE